MLQNLLFAAIVIGALRVNIIYFSINEEIPLFKLRYNLGKYKLNLNVFLLV